MVLLGSCQGAVAPIQDFIVAYVDGELPGERAEQNLLSSFMMAYNAQENESYRLVQKIYPNEVELEQALLRQEPIDMALLPDWLLQRFENQAIKPEQESGEYVYLPNVNEHRSTTLNQALKKAFPTEQNKSFLDSFVPYSYGHYGLLYRPATYPHDLRTLRSTLDYVLPSNLKTHPSLPGRHYLANRMRFQEDLSLLFTRFLNQDISLLQWQQALKDYGNVLDETTLSTYRTIHNFDDESNTIAQDDVLWMKGHLASRHYITQAFSSDLAFTFPRDGSLFYFDGLMILDSEHMLIASAMIDFLFEPDNTIQSFEMTHKTPFSIPISLLQYFNQNESQHPTNQYQVDLTYIFSEKNTQESMVFNLTPNSLLLATYPNENVFIQSAILLPHYTDGFLEEYRYQTLGIMYLIQRNFLSIMGSVLMIFLILIFLLRVQNRFDEIHNKTIHKSYNRQKR